MAKPKNRRDIDIQKLISYIIQAGGRKIRVNSPSVKTITNTQIAYCTGVNITYKGTVKNRIQTGNF